jgi:hypothetical protein
MNQAFPAQKMWIQTLRYLAEAYFSRMVSKTRTPYLPYLMTRGEEVQEKE